MTRIWFNHWFSTVFNVIRMLKQENPDFYFIGTNERDQAAYRLECDEWYIEPVLSREDYVKFCLEFCRAHQVDVFIPRRHFMTISKHKADFAEIGVKVLVDDFDLIEPLNHKAAAYSLLSGIPELLIPDYYTVTNAAAFQEAYAKIEAKYGRVCFKFEQDEGGKSFRQIDDTRKGFAALSKRMTTRMTLDEAIAALSEVESFPSMMVMPYLPGEEVSVDCLDTASGLLMIPRFKGATRTERIAFPNDILQMCEAFHKAVPLQAPFNIQFKYLDGTPYFLEVNTRMSGGIQMSCAGVNVNLPDLAVNKLLGIDKEWNLEKKERYVTHVEIPVVF